MVSYTWAVGIGKFQTLPVMSSGGGGSQFPGLGGTPEKRHETCQNSGIMVSNVGVNTFTKMK